MCYFKKMIYYKKLLQGEVVVVVIYVKSIVIDLILKKIKMFFNVGLLFIIIVIKIVMFIRDSSIDNKFIIVVKVC